MHSDGNVLVIPYGALLPAGGYLPPMLGSMLGADQKVSNFDRSVATRTLEKLAHRGHDFADENVPIVQSSVP